MSGLSFRIFRQQQGGVPESSLSQRLEDRDKTQESGWACGPCGSMRVPVASVAPRGSLPGGEVPWELRVGSETWGRATLGFKGLPAEK